jgi:transposase-like protein
VGGLAATPGLFRLGSSIIDLEAAMPPIELLSATVAAELKVMYERGDRLADIARHFGVGEKTLRAWCSEQNLSPRKIPRTKPVPRERDAALLAKMFEMYGNPSIRLDSILEEFSIPLSTFYAELQKSGRPRRTKRDNPAHQLGSTARSEIVELYKNPSILVKDIASQFGVEYHQVYVVLREAGITIDFHRSKRGRRDRDTQMRFCELYADDAISVRSIMKQLSLTRDDVDWIMNELAIPRRGKGGTRREKGRGTLEQRNAVAELVPDCRRRYENGESLAKISDDTGIPASTLRRRLVELGVFPRKPKNSRKRSDPTS